MDHSSPNGSGASPTLVVDIIETLEACGLDRHEYQLNDSVDVEALEQVLHSSSGDAKVQFTVKNTARGDTGKHRCCSVERKTAAVLKF